MIANVRWWIKWHWEYEFVNKYVRHRWPAWVGRHLPEGLIYWGMIAVGVRYIRDDEVVPGVPFMDILGRVGKENV